MKFIIIFLALISAVSSTTIVDCGSSAPVDMDKLTVTGCKPHQRYCIFKRGESAVLSLPFTPHEPTKNLTAVVHGIIAGIPVPFPLPQPNACLNSGLTCPLVPGTEITYSAQLPVKKSYPRLRLKVKWEIQDSTTGHDIVCIEIPVWLR